jgi:hypothetical protein
MLGILFFIGSFHVIWLKLLFMKHLFLLFLLFASSSFLRAQAQNKGAFSFNLAYDAGVHGTLYTEEYKGNTDNNPDTSAAGTQMIRINAQYNILKWLSAGLDLRSGSYLEDPENATANGNKIRMFGLNLRLYPVNRDKFVWYFGTTLGSSKLEINRIYTFIISVPAQYKLKSPHFNLETGFNWYFLKNFGLNFGIGYSTQNYLLTEYYLNKEKQDLSDWNNTLKTAGIHVDFGLAFHFGGR